MRVLPQQFLRIQIGLVRCYLGENMAVKSQAYEATPSQVSPFVCEVLKGNKGTGWKPKSHDSHYCCLLRFGHVWATPCWILLRIVSFFSLASLTKHLGSFAHVFKHAIRVTPGCKRDVHFVPIFARSWRNPAKLQKASRRPKVRPLRLAKDNEELEAAWSPAGHSAVQLLSSRYLDKIIFRTHA